MSGVEKLLQAAEFLEQQEQQTLSPLPNALSFEGPLNGQHNNSQRTNSSSSSSSSSNGLIINSRSSSVRHAAANLVSSSAPAASGEFQHINGLCGTGGGIGGVVGSSNSQLATAHQPQMSNGFDYSNANSGSKSGQVPAPIANGRSAANQLVLHNGGSTGGTIMEDTHMSYSSNSNHSPPRHSAGSHYMQINTGSGSQVVHQLSVGSSGRRRTISSNSNGAGTREVHNKLEKNRRAHLKECYESLKSVLQLKDEDRKKTSNLAILGEAYKNVVRLQHRKNEQEHQIEQLAKDKITYQKKICTLKRDLGTKYEQIFAGVFPDTELGNIPHDRVTESSDSVYLSSGHGSLMYSSSSSLSSGGSGSNGNSRSSPIAAGQLQAAMATVMSSVIAKTTNSTSHNATSTVTTTAPISPNALPQNNPTPDPALSIAAPAQSIPPTSSPSALNVVNISTMPLQLTTKNIAAVASARSVSPNTSTSTMSTSPSSSSASSSPPINGLLNGHNLSVNIPNGIKYHTTGTGASTATIIATSAPTATAGSRNTNAHAYTLGATTTTTAAPAASVSLAISTTPTKHNGSRQAYGRKMSLSILDDRKSKTGTKNEHEREVGEPPAKMPKVYSNILASSDHASLTIVPKSKQLTTAAPLPLSTLNGTNGQVQLSQVVGGGSLVVSPSYIPVTTASGHLRASPATSMQKLLVNNGGATGEIGRLPGGAELNILPASGMNGTKVNGTSAAFYHANGNLTLMNGGATVGGNNGIVMKDKNASATPTVVSTPMQVQTNSNAMAPLIVTSNGNGAVHYNSNFAHLLAATSLVSAAVPTTYSTVGAHSTTSASLVTHERLNGKLRSSIVGEVPPINSQQYQKSVTSTRPMVINVTTTAPMSGAQKLNTTTTNTPTLPQSYVTMKPATSVNSRLKVPPTLATITTTTKPKTIPPIKTTATLSSPAFSNTSLMQSHAPVYTASYASVTMTSSSRPANATATGPTNGNVS